MAKKEFDVSDKYNEEVAEFKQVGFKAWVAANKGLAAGILAVGVVILFVVLGAIT